MGPEVPYTSGHEATDPSEPSFNFERYRDVIDSGTIGSRKLGLMDSELAKQALADERTVVMDAGGQQIPALVPIEYVEGWDHDRARKVAQDGDSEYGDVYYLALSGDLTEDLLQQPEAIMALASRARQGMRLYFEHTSFQDDKVVGNLGRLLSSAGISWQELPLVDSQAQVGREQATMSFYSAKTHHIQAETTGLESIGIFEKFEQLVRDGKYEKLPQDGVTLLSSEDLSIEIREQLWQLYEERFQDLGENHPISMEDNREFFEQLIETEGTTLSVYFVDGSPVAFMFFMTDPKALSWINEGFIEEHVQDTEEFLFFPGIVARVDGVGHYAEPTIQLPTQIIAQTNLDYNVCFESTNRSSGYIPRLVEEYVNNTGILSIDPPSPLDTTYYRCLKLNVAS